MAKTPCYFSFDLDGTLVQQDYVAKVRRLRLIVGNGNENIVDDSLVVRAIREANIWYEQEASATKLACDDLWFTYARQFMQFLPFHSDILIKRCADYFYSYNQDANNFVVPILARNLLNKLVSRGSRLFVISANLDATQRIQLVGLKNCFTRILSPRNGSTKSDLFPKLLQSENINPKTMLHIGDDPFTDSEVPAWYGINSFLLVDKGDRDEHHAIELSELLRRTNAGYSKLAAALSINLSDKSEATS